MKAILNRENYTTDLPELDDGEVDELEAWDIIDLYPEEESKKFVRELVGKLAHGGSIMITCSDMISVAKAISARQVDQKQGNFLLYGPTGDRKCSWTGTNLKDYLVSFGLKIMKYRMSQYKLIIVARRD